MANKIPLAIADLELQLATAVPVGATFFTLSSATDDDGVALPAGMYCFTLDSGTSNKEYLLGQVNGTAVTSVMSVSRQGVETSGAAREHRVGAPCIVTNFATLQRVADILRGELTLDGASPISYDTAPTLSDGKELATVQYVLDNVAGGTVTFNAQVVTGVNAGEVVSAGQLVYLNTTDQEWYLCDADTAASVNGVEVGIALGSGTDGAAISGGVLLRGVRTTSGLTAGAAYYASNTAGGLSTSAGTTSLQVGIALSTTVLLFNPREFNTPTAKEKIFIANATGLISMYGAATAPTGWLLCDGSAVSRTTYADLFAVTSTTYGVGDGSTTFNVPNLTGRFPLGYASVAPTKVLTFASRASNVITVTGADNHANNELQTGQAVLYTAASGAMTGLTHNTTYYLIRVTATTFSLATSVANANAGTVISLSSDGTGAQTFTLTYTARPMGEKGGEEIHALTDAEMPSHTHNMGSDSGTGDGISDTTAAVAISTFPTSSAGSDTPHNNMPLYTVVNYIIKT